MAKEKTYICQYMGRYFLAKKSLIGIVARTDGCEVYEERKRVRFYNKKTGDIKHKFSAYKRIRNEKELNDFINKSNSITEVAFGFFNINHNENG